MFKFNFDVEEGKEEVGTKYTLEEEAGTEELPMAALEVVRETDADAVQSAICDEDVLEVGERTLYRPVFSSELFLVSAEEEKAKPVAVLGDESLALAKALVESRDVVPGVYEGGFKLWECSVDLLHYLHDAAVPLKGKRIAELGCGVGMPAVYAALEGAAHVMFQDYNKEVLLHLTIPAVRRNLEPMRDTGFAPSVEFLAGDWEHVEERGEKYDLILTTDTLYAPQAHKKLCSCILSMLSPGGIALVAAKSYYFGVGGSVVEFQKYAESSGFSVTHLKTIGDKKSNVREIIQLQAPL